MRALGIGLLIFNLLLTAAIALYLAPQSWSKRQVMNASVAKLYLAKTGLPLQASDFDSNAGTQPISFQTTDQHVVSAVSTELLTGYFTGTDKPPVNSQMEELERAYKELQGELNGKNPGEVITMLAGGYKDNLYVPGLLAQLAPTYKERSEIRALIPRGQSGANELADASGKLKAILTSHYDLTKASGSELEKKDRIAHLLAFMNPASNTWQKRVILVVGLLQYSKMLGQKTAMFSDGEQEMARRIEQDQDAFLQEYELLRKLAVERGQLRNLQKEVETLAGQNQNDDDKAVNARTTQKNDRDKELADLQKKNADILTVNADLEKRLQDQQRQVSLLLDKIASEEARLESIEKTGK
jgi:hypothetical protein